MDPGKRALLRTTVRDALERAASDPSPKVDEVLLGLGWLEMLRAEPRDAVDVVFTTLGVTNATATVLGEERHLAVRSGRFEDRFTPYGVHLYRIE